MRVGAVLQQAADGGRVALLRREVERGLARALLLLRELVPPHEDEPRLERRAGAEERAEARLAAGGRRRVQRRDTIGVGHAL